MLNGVKKKQGENPATLFEQISSIENKYNTAVTKIAEEDLIAVVLDAATAEYQAVLTSIEQRMKGGNVKMEDLETCMRINIGGRRHRTKMAETTTKLH
jgi:hypothetical protein